MLVRPVEPADGDECARIVYETFGTIHDHHRFERDFPMLEDAVQLTILSSRTPRSGVCGPASFLLPTRQAESSGGVFVRVYASSSRYVHGDRPIPRTEGLLDPLSAY